MKKSLSTSAICEVACSLRDMKIMINFGMPITNILSDLEQQSLSFGKLVDISA